MAFKFKFQALLKHRKTLRDLAQREYAEAEAKVAAQMNYIESLYQQIDRTNDKILDIREQKKVDMDLLKSLEEFIELQKIKISQERMKARELLSVREEKQEILIEKAKDFKMVEILKEKQKQRHLEELRKLETKEMDDLNLMRHLRS